MEVRRAALSDAPAIAAFLCHEFASQLNTGGSPDWTEERARRWIEKYLTPIALKGGEVVGVAFFGFAEDVLWGVPTRVGYTSLYVASGHPVRQVRVIDLLFSLAYRACWLPQAIAYCTVRGRADSPSATYWRKCIHGSEVPLGIESWGIVSVAGAMRHIEERRRP